MDKILNQLRQTCSSVYRRIGHFQQLIATETPSLVARRAAERAAGEPRAEEGDQCADQPQGEEGQPWRYQVGRRIGLYGRPAPGSGGPALAISGYLLG